MKTFLQRIACGINKLTVYCLRMFYCLSKSVTENIGELNHAPYYISVPLALCF